MPTRQTFTNVPVGFVMLIAAMAIWPLHPVRAASLVEYDIAHHASSQTPIAATIQAPPVDNLHAGNLLYHGSGGIDPVSGPGDFVIQGVPFDLPGPGNFEPPDPNQFYEFSLSSDFGSKFVVNKLIFSLGTRLSSFAIGPQRFDLYATTDQSLSNGRFFSQATFLGAFGPGINRQTIHEVTDFSALGNTTFDYLEFHLFGYQSGGNRPGGLLNVASGTSWIGGPSIRGQGSNLLVEGVAGDDFFCQLSSTNLGCSALGGSGVTDGLDIAFDQISQPGLFVADSSPIVSIPSLDFLLPTGQSWDLNFTGTFAGLATLTFNYDDIFPGETSETNLFLLHILDDGTPEVLPGVVDPVLNTITVRTSSLSPFFLALPSSSAPEPITIALLGLGLAGMGFSRRRRHT